MWIILAFFLAGGGAGYVLRNRPGLIKAGSHANQTAIFVLLFLMGAGVGASPAVMNNLSRLGWQAALISLGAVAGSVLLAWLLQRFFSRGPGHER